MAGDYDELKQLLVELLTNRFAPKPTFIRGLLGDGLGNVTVPDRPDKNYVRFNRSATEFFEVFNVTVNAVNDWPVLIGELPWLQGLTQVVGTDWAAYEQSGWDDNVGATSPHSPTHEWPDGVPGSDPTNIYMRSIVPLRAYILGTGSTTIYANSYEYENPNTSGTVWGGLPGIDLLPAMSALSTGTARLMGIYLDPSINTLGIVTGAVDIFTDASDPPSPQFPSGILPVARIRVYGGQASIGEVDIRDARQPFSYVKDTTPNENPIINGNFPVWERGTSFAAIASGDFFADRWVYFKTGVMVHTASRSTDVPSPSATSPYTEYSALIDCTTIDASIAAGDFALVQQKIEGYNFHLIAQRQFTLSFWVKATKTGIYCIAFRNSGLDRSYVAEYTVNVTDTWEYKTITVSASPSAGTWDYTTGVGMDVNFSLATGSTYQTTPNAWQTGNFLATANQVNACDSTANDFRLAMVKPKPGIIATEFVPLDIEVVLSKCKRYYQRVGAGMFGVWGSASVATLSTILPVEMRAAPTAALLTTSPVINEISVANRTGSSSTISSSQLNARGIHVKIDGFTGATVQNGARPVTVEVIELDAEL